MSYIRAAELPEWEENAFDGGVYVYSDADGLCYVPKDHREFTELVMRMLDQSGEMTESELETAHAALRERLRVDGDVVGRRDVNQDAYTAGGDEDA